MGTDGYQTYRGDHFEMYLNVKSLRCTPDTNIILYVNYISIKNKIRGFPGGAVVENLPANAGDTGSSPDLGRSHMLWSN